jgi:hypothetical protein
MDRIFLRAGWVMPRAGEAVKRRKLKSFLGVRFMSWGGLTLFMLRKSFGLRTFKGTAIYPAWGRTTLRGI